MHDIRETEVRDENGYSIFEPALSFHIGAIDVFGAIGKPKIPHVVIMHAREEWLKKTAAMVRHMDEGLPQTQ